MRTARLFSTTLILLLISALFLPSGSAQDYTRWHLPEGAIVRFENGGVRDFAYLPDGNRLIVLSAIGLWIYDVHTGEELELFTDLGTKQVWNFMVPSPDGQTVASSSWQTIELWNTVTGEHIGTFTGYPGWIRAMAFSPDGKTLASGNNGTVILWDMNRIPVPDQ